MSDLNTIPCTLEDAKAILIQQAQHMWDIPVMLWGEPGIGKTHTILGLGEAIQKEMKLQEPVPVIDQRLTTMDNADLRGLPSFDEEAQTTTFYVPSWLPTKEGPGILLLGELPAAEPRVQVAAYQLLMERRIGDYELPDGWLIVADGNHTNHGAVSYDMTTAIADRFLHLDVAPDVDAFVAHALHNDFDSRIIAFVKSYPQYLSTNQEQLENDELIGCSARSLARVSAFFKGPAKHLEQGHQELAVMGLVGKTVASEIFTFLERMEDACSVDEILKSNQQKRFNETFPTNVGGLYNLIFATSKLVKDKNSFDDIVGIYYDLLEWHRSGAIRSNPNVDGMLPVLEAVVCGMEEVLDKALANDTLKTYAIDSERYIQYEELREELGLA